MPPPNPKNQGLLAGAAYDLGLSDLFTEELLNEEQRRKRLKDGQRENPALYGDMVLGNAAMQLFPEYGKRK